MLDLIATGCLPQSGLVAQEEMPLEVFLAKRFGAVYAPRDSGARVATAQSRPQ